MKIVQSRSRHALTRIQGGTAARMNESAHHSEYGDYVSPSSCRFFLSKMRLDARWFLMERSFARRR